MPYRLLKLLDDRIITRVVLLFNHLVANGFFPDCWKNAIVVPIPKPGKNHKVVSNWRPISLLPCLSKVFERLIASRIRTFCCANDIIPPHQFGFQNELSTCHPLAILQNRISAGLNSSKITTTVCLDIKAAFDTVWHEGLVYKLGLLKFPKYIQLIIFHFLSNRSFKVRVGSAFSDPFDIPAGVPQGSVLGPLLFNLSMADIPTDPEALLLQYADDTSISFTYEKVDRGIECKINNFLSTLVEWYRYWKFMLNADKTELVHFVGSLKHVTSWKRKKLKRLIIRVNQITISPKSSMKYLGVHFSRNNRFNLHVDNILVKATNSKALLNRFICSQLIDVKFKRFLYTVYLRPILTYACAIWLNPTNISSFQIEKFRRLERKLIRSTMNIFRRRHSFRFLSNEKLLELFNRSRIDVHMVDLSVRFHERCSYSLNPLVNEYINNCNDADVSGSVASNFASTKFIFNLNARERLRDREGLITLFNRRHSSPEELLYSVCQ